MSNSNEISIEIEGPNNIIIESKFNKNRIINVNGDINKLKNQKKIFFQKKKYYIKLILFLK